MGKSDMPEQTANTLMEAPESDVERADGLVFNLLELLPGRVSSEHTMRAYHRWIDRYLTDVAGMEPIKAQQRDRRLATLPINTLLQCLSAPQLRAWLGKLVAEGHGKQGINQARASIVTLSSLLAEAGWLEDHISAGMGNVRIPKVADGQRPGRWLSPEEIKILMRATREIATTENQRRRNTVVITMLCTMALRRDELSKLLWSSVTTANRRPMLNLRGKGNKMASVDIPRPVAVALKDWRESLTVAFDEPPEKGSPLLRRIWKNGRIASEGLTVAGIWRIIDEAAEYANIGHVAPHDLRRSVAGTLQESGVSIDQISRLLRHSNVAVTERYLSRLPQRNEGAVLMSDVLGLEDGDGDDDDWFDF